MTSEKKRIKQETLIFTTEQRKQQTRGEKVFIIIRN